MNDSTDRSESPWYCPVCVTWVGWRLDECSNGHARPQLPLRYCDVPFDYSRKVTLRHRLRAKLRGLLEVLA